MAPWSADWAERGRRAEHDRDRGHWPVRGQFPGDSGDGGPQALIAWLAGALLATLDAFVWSELGAAMPKAGGTYVFLREAYGPERWGG